MQENSKHPLTDQEKLALRNRILVSARKADHDRKWKFRRRILMGAAACMLVLLGLTFYLDQKPEPGLEDFVRSAPKAQPNSSGQITIILGEGENLSLDEDQPGVEYSESGTDVRVGNKSVRQHAVRDNKVTYNTILVPFGKRTDLKLSDGTVVWINSGSKLVYPAVFKGDNREVYLEGEAIFEVAHDAEKPFRVLSEHQRIEVLGTVFNVSTYPEDSETSTVLKSGSVRVTYAGSDRDPLKMRPGTRTSFNPQTHSVKMQRVNPDDYFSWREGFLSLNKHSLGDIALKLSRYYNIQVRVENETLARETFSGKLDLKEDVRSVIDIISETTEIQMIEAGGQIILTN